MNARVNRIVTAFALCALLATNASRPAVAIRPRPANSLPTKSDVVLIGVAVAAIGAGVGFAIYFSVRPHNRSITGCASSGPGGMQLTSESDRQTYALVGDLGAVKSGDRVRVSGKQEKHSAAPSPQFLVEKLAKDYGPCTVSAPAP